MKNHMKLAVALLCTVLLIFIITPELKSQGPPPPPKDEEHNIGHGSDHDNPPPDGGSAPLGSGVAILLTMGAGYGIWKYRQSGKQS